MKTLFFFLFAGLSMMLPAQVLQEKRIEFEIKDGYDNEEIHSFGKNGFIVSSRSDERSGDETDWRYELYNTDMEVVKTKNVPVTRKFASLSSEKSNYGLHTLYGRKNDFTLISVESGDLSVKSVDGKLPKKSYLGAMKVLGDRAYFPASVKKKPFIFSINWKTGRTNLIPVIIDNVSSKKTYIESMQVMEGSGEMLVYITVKIKKKKSEVYIMRINEKGEKTDLWHLSGKFSENIVEISGSRISENELIFTGTYARGSISMSEGLFFCRFENEKVDLIKFYNFTDMKEFLSYLPERNQRKLEKKKEKKESQGKEFSISYRIADHSVIAAGGDFYFLGEAFYPTYRTETYTETRVVNGVTTYVTRTRQVFDGYQYTHAILAKFDKKGKLVWDRCFEMWPSYKPFTVKRFIKVSITEDEAVSMVFASHSRIISKSVGFDGDVKLEAKSEPIETGKEGDKTRMSYSNLDYWYDKYFLAYGQQVIKNKEDKSVKKKRKVYFISKIGY